MAEVAYELSRFAPREQEEKDIKPPRVRVAKQRGKATKQVFKMVRVLLTVGLFVVLVCGVLYTQTTVTELQSEISGMDQELVEQEALYAYLSFELESMTTPRAIEQRAGEMGLVQLNSNQITYVQVEEGDQIEVREGAFSGVLERIETGLKALMDQIRPK